MIRLDHPQGSPAWVQARLGLPTASCFDRIFTKTGKPSTQAVTYMHEKLAEYFLQQPMDAVSSAYMERGSELEAEAREWYSLVHEQIEPCGLCTTDDGRAGASPDGFVGSDGLVEIKCLSAPNHIGRCLADASDYRVQCQGQLWVCERQWCDRISYNPVLPSVVVRVERDEEFIAKLAEAVRDWCDCFDEAREQLEAMGFKRRESVTRCFHTGYPIDSCECGACLDENAEPAF